jgi:hypothetical protein
MNLSILHSFRRRALLSNYPLEADDNNQSKKSPRPRAFNFSTAELDYRHKSAVYTKPGQRETHSQKLESSSRGVITSAISRHCLRPSLIVSKGSVYRSREKSVRASVGLFGGDLYLLLSSLLDERLTKINWKTKDVRRRAASPVNIQKWLLSGKTLSHSLAVCCR